MNDTKLVSGIHELLCASQTTGDRYMIRFPTARYYRHYYQQLRALGSSQPNPLYLQPLPLINGFACWLTKPESLQALFPLIKLEKDSKPAWIHTISESPSRMAASRMEPFIPWGVKQIKAPVIWARSAGSRVRIGVIDTGIDFMHPDFHGQVSSGINLIHHHLHAMDDNGHGTHIAGTIAAASRRKGILGVAPAASLYAIKAFDQYGSAYVSDIIAGIEWCLRNRMNIANMSFGLKEHSLALEEAVKRAYRAGLIIVASSGNEGKSLHLDYPAQFQHTISVGATTRNKKIAPFSNKGKRVDIYAPGHRILSTWLYGKYQELSGTSMATSHVSGVIALLLSIKPSLSPGAVKEILQSNSSTLLAKRKITRTGEIQAVRAIKAVTALL